MNLRQVTAELKKRGTAQNRKIYGRHGVREPMYGVSFAHLKDLVKRIGVDHPLALGLWSSGNHDARVLATMVADPEAFRAVQLEGWVRDLDNYVVADALSGLVARTRFARSKAEKWSKSRREFIGATGYNLLTFLAMRDETLPDGYFVPIVERIETQIHQRANRMRHAMNQTLIAIGVRNAALRKQALAAARRMGKVEVDHGETSCKTPDAAACIARTIAHRSA
jgi:3-methyladenine DNA glycosylase AlkD